MTFTTMKTRQEEEVCDLKAILTYYHRIPVLSDTVALILLVSSYHMRFSVLPSIPN